MNGFHGGVVPFSKSHGNWVFRFHFWFDLVGIVACRFSSVGFCLAKFGFWKELAIKTKHIFFLVETKYRQMNEEEKMEKKRKREREIYRKRERDGEKRKKSKNTKIKSKLVVFVR